jgi:hypothetical protein
MIKGFVELLRPFQVRGWAYDDNAPASPVEVALLLKGALVGSGVADVFREDLISAGVGDGHHGFILNVDHQISAGEEDDIVVEVRNLTSGELVTLPHMPDLKISEPAQAITAIREPVTTIRGFFTLSAGDQVVGWAYDADRPDDHIAVEALLHGRRVGMARALEFRPDLLRAMIGNGDHGFTLAIDTSIRPEDLANIEVYGISEAGQRKLLQTVRREDEPSRSEPTRAVMNLNPVPYDVDRAQRPVFILGAARSGTSAIAQALVKTTRYLGHEEGHLLDVIAPLFACIDRHYGERGEEWSGRTSTLIAAVPKTFLESGVKRIFVELARTLFPAGWWLDKTPRPSMIAVAPLLREIWPEARFIFMKRRGIENVASRLRKFPAIPFEDHCRDWTLVMQSWLATRAALSGASIEIDQIELATSPEEIGAILAPLLLLGHQETKDFVQALKLDRPERTSSNFATPESFDSVNWTEHQKRVFLEICGSLMQTFGYGTAVDYFINR